MALQQLISAQSDATSSLFHQWLTPDEFGAQFGVAQEDIDKITGWLKSHGFTAGGVAKSRTAIEFSGTSLQIREAFHTELHLYEVHGKQYWANSGDPEIPQALAAVVSGVNSLNNYPKEPTSHVIGKVPGLRPSAFIAPNYTSSSGDHYVAPGDFWTIYNATPAIQAGTTGKGVANAVAGRSDISASDVSTFRATYLGGAAYTGTFQQIINGPDPGDVPGDDLENTLDVEWASALAPDATVTLVISQSNGADGVDLSAEYLVDNNLADVVSVSYGACKSLGTTENEFLSNLWAQAAAQGITALVAAGDGGSAGCDITAASGDATAPTVAQFGLQVNGLASTAYNVAVGGTEFYNEGSSWNPVDGLQSASGNIRARLHSRRDLERQLFSRRLWRGKLQSVVRRWGG